jgi:hypothetical protein
MCLASVMKWNLQFIMASHPNAPVVRRDQNSQAEEKTDIDSPVHMSRRGSGSLVLLCLRILNIDGSSCPRTRSHAPYYLPWLWQPPITSVLIGPDRRSSEATSFGLRYHALRGCMLHSPRRFVPYSHMASRDSISTPLFSPGGYGMYQLLHPFACRTDVCYATESAQCVSIVVLLLEESRHREGGHYVYPVVMFANFWATLLQLLRAMPTDAHSDLPHIVDDFTDLWLFFFDPHIRSLHASDLLSSAFTNAVQLCEFVNPVRELTDICRSSLIDRVLVDYPLLKITRDPDIYVIQCCRNLDQVSHGCWHFSFVLMLH